ncbi:MAG: hypothetical protein GY938_32670 [Ketobacter sp.]|nr:hypothetical protein [Ketobacter sp.]
MDYTLPNGKTIGGIPDGTAELEIVRNAIKKGWASPDDFGFLPEEWTPNNTPDAGINPIAGNFQALGQGVTFGNADELQAAVGAATTTEDASGKGILDRYRAIRDQIRAERQQFINQEGAIAYAPEVIGGLMTGGSGLARTVPSGWRGMMATGAVEGGIAGAGFAPGDIIEDPTPTILGTSAGAAAGGVGGLAGYGVGNIAGRMGGMTVEKLKQQFPNTRGVPEQAARQSAEGDGLSDDMARYVINKGKATKDPLYSAAKTQGVSDGTRNAIKEL